MATEIAMNRLARATVASLLAMSAAACDQLATAKVVNRTGVALLLRVDDLPEGLPPGSGYALAPGRSVMLVADTLIEGPVSVLARDCTYNYRFSRADPAFQGGYDGRYKLDVRPDLGIYIGSSRTGGFFARRIRNQPPGWPLTPVSKTCH